jgi:hypothetical protein
MRNSEPEGKYNAMTPIKISSRERKGLPYQDRNSGRSTNSYCFGSKKSPDQKIAENANKLVVLRKMIRERETDLRNKDMMIDNLQRDVSSLSSEVGFLRKSMQHPLF